jgi:hypothetical protein
MRVSGIVRFPGLFLASDDRHWGWKTFVYLHISALFTYPDRCFHQSIFSALHQERSTRRVRIGGLSALVRLSFQWRLDPTATSRNERTCGLEEKTKGTLRQRRNIGIWTYATISIRRTSFVPNLRASKPRPSQPGMGD